MLKDGHYEPTYANDNGYWNAHEKDVPKGAEAVEPVANATNPIEGELQHEPRNKTHPMTRWRPV